MREKGFSRRAFVKTVGAFGVGSALAAGCSLTGNGPAQGGAKTKVNRSVSGGIELDDHWLLLLDPDASWEQDTLFLPEDADLTRLPVNAPTGGWDELQSGLAVTLPTTVEEHLAEFLERGTLAAGGLQGDLTAGTAYYRGVSWWWRRFKSPQLAPGQNAIINFRGARLRSEVYCNRQLCGYSILTELPFAANVTAALAPEGDNLLAVRITNPGGFLDWNDLRNLIKWGPQSLPGSHAFGGLDRSIVLEVRDAVSVTDLAVFNRPDLRSVRLRIEVTSTGPAYKGPIEIVITRGKNVAWSGRISSAVNGGGTATFEHDATLENAELWSPDKPALYCAAARLPGLSHSGRSVQFGFRGLAVVGLGSDARLHFNERRMVPRSAISWGYWAPNGLWPTPELAVKEVEVAKALGLTCLQAHRNLAKPEVLDAQDRLGLLRCEEPGAGAKAFDPTAYNEKEAPLPKGNVDVSGQGGEPRNFVERYEWAKILAMLRRDRSHPCLVIYTVQNEQGPDLKNPRIFALLRKMRGVDPSRIIVLHSGGVPQNQAFLLPWDEEIRHEDGHGASGWLDLHDAMCNPGNWLDGDYQNPDHYLYHSRPGIWQWDLNAATKQLPFVTNENRGEIVVLGEMGGIGVPDSHQVISDWYRKHNRYGYDRSYHDRIAAGYEKFLDASGFRGEFPTATDVFEAVGKKSYFFWQKALENGRMEDVNDYLVISGWESTVIDNHSGIVDMHRNPRCDPAILRQATLPELLVVRPRHYIFATGEKAVVDVFLINETGRKGRHFLTLIGKGPDGAKLAQTTVEVQVTGGEVFGQLLHAGWECPLAGQGITTFEATLHPSLSGAPALSRSEAVQVISLAPDTNRAVAVLDRSGATEKALAELGVSMTDPAMAKTVVCVEDFTEVNLMPLLERVKNSGLRLVLWANAGAEARAAAETLAARKIVNFSGNLGSGDAPWFGSWYVVRQHPLFKGLATGCAMDWRYQAVANKLSDGVLLEAPGLQMAAAYGRHHEARVAMGAGVIPLGQGTIVLFSLPGLRQALAGDGAGIHPVVARRLLLNALTTIGGV